jgi:Na+/H+ antiporter NhaD/arsenite permease-like protein
VSAAVLSLLALVVAIALSMTSRINVGWLALAFAWLIGVYRADMRAEVVMAGFPVSLFVTLTGVTLLFAVAEVNGTLAVVAARIIRIARGNARIIPLLFFVVACGLSSVGPGAISTVALLAPLAMAIGDRTGVGSTLTALMVANGANAGNLSPFSSVGIIANSAMSRVGLGGHETRVWFANFAAHVIVGAAAYAAMAGRRADQDGGRAAGLAAAEGAGGVSARHQALTVTIIAAWIAGVLLFDFSLGLSAFAGAAILLLLSPVDEATAVRRMPWGIIMMVSGMSILIAVLEKTGGMDLFTSLLARAASPETIYGVIAFVTGAISTYSSTSGVVLPAFLPTVPGLVQRIGGGDPLAVALSINVGSALVDVSPLSTIGALCVAAVAEPSRARRLFRALMIWGVSMTVVGAVLCQLFATSLARLFLPGS